MVYIFPNTPNGIAQSAIDNYISEVAERNYDTAYWPTWVYDTIVRSTVDQTQREIRAERFKAFVFFLRNGFSPMTAFQLCVIASFFNGRPWPFAFLQDEFINYTRIAQERPRFFDTYPAYSIFLQTLTQKHNNENNFDNPIPRPPRLDYLRIRTRLPLVFVHGLWNNWMFNPAYPTSLDDPEDYDEIDGYATP
jgi:hypothetical protein